MPLADGRRSASPSMPFPRSWLFTPKAVSIALHTGFLLRRAAWPFDSVGLPVRLKVSLIACIMRALANAQRVRYNTGHVDKLPPFLPRTSFGLARVRLAHPLALFQLRAGVQIPFVAVCFRLFLREDKVVVRPKRMTIAKGVVWCG
jgi:hypothetical protein